MTPVLRCLCGLALIALTGLLGGCVDTGSDRRVLRIEQAGFVLSTSETPPAVAAFEARSVTLPDAWRQRRAEGSEGWYRATWSMDTAPDELWAVYLPRVGMNAAVWVNGRFLGDGGRMTPPITRNWNRPLLFTLPAALLKPGENEVFVHIVQLSIAPPYLAPISIGPAMGLRELHQRRSFLQVTLSQLGVVVTLLIALLTLVIFHGRDPTGSHRWFVAAALAWSYGGIEALLSEPLFEGRFLEWSTTTATCLTPVFLAFVLHRTRGLTRPRLEAGFVGFSVLASAALALVPDFWVFYTQVAWMSIACISAVYLLAHLIPTMRAHGDPHVWRPPFVGAVVAVALGAHDIVAIGFAHSNDEPLLLGLMPVVVMLGVGWSLVARLAAGLSESERLNLELEERVETKHRELEDSYSRARKLERDSAVADERERIMRDMHDGMGGQLVSTLAMVESGATGGTVADALREALDEMRTVIDSLDPMDGDLAAVLATLRLRFEPRLARDGIRIAWGITDVPELAWLGPGQILDVSRIVQEAITNVLKHAGASEIRLSTQEEAIEGHAGITIEIVDNGRGIAANHAGGRGLKNMERRASRLGGTIAFESNGDGSAIRLWLPIERGQRSRN